MYTWSFFLAIRFIFIAQPFSLLFSGGVISVTRALDYRVGGHRFDSWGLTNTQGLKITEKCRYFLYTATG